MKRIKAMLILGALAISAMLMPTPSAKADVQWSTCDVINIGWEPQSYYYGGYHNITNYATQSCTSTQDDGGIAHMHIFNRLYRNGLYMISAGQHDCTNPPYVNLKQCNNSKLVYARCWGNTYQEIAQGYYQRTPGGAVTWPYSDASKGVYYYYTSGCVDYPMDGPGPGEVLASPEEQALLAAALNG